MAELSLREKVRSSDIQRKLRGELLRLCIKRRHLRRFRHLVRMPPRRSHLQGHVQLGGDAAVEPELVGEILHPILPRNTSVSHGRSWKVLLGRGMSGPRLVYCLLDKWKMMDGRMDFFSPFDSAGQCC